MKKLLISLLLALLGSTAVMADYTDVPFTIKSNGQFSYTSDTGTYTFSTKTGYYQEWDHYVIFWSTSYGSKTGTVTTIGSGDYLLNLTQMQQYAELCYDNYISLGFLTPAHKIIILAYYTTEWEATGSGQGAYGLLNISHASANPSANYYTYCHEIAHAYQYLGNQKNGGNAGFQYGDYYGYVSYYECCGNWQAAQEYPELYFPQSMGIYNKTTNLNWLHSWHCYQSYIFNDYFTEKCGQTTIGDIWTVNTNTQYADPLEKYMHNTGATAEDVYREIFYAAMRTVTWDLTRWDNYLSAQGVSRDKYMDHRMGTQAGANGATTTPVTYSDTYYPTASTYQYVTTNSSSAIHQVAYSSCPQSTGFNVIKLNVPTSSTSRTVTTTFTALAPGASLASGDNKEYWCGSMWAKSSSQTKYNTGGLTSEANTTYNTYKSWRGFRLGYVTYKKSTGKRYYNFSDQVYCTGTSETSINIQFDVPSDVDSLYLVVSPALSSYLRAGSVDPYSISSNANYVSTQQSLDQWPYRVQFYGTNIYGLSNPSTSFSGTAVTGTTYTSETLPDLAGDQTEKTYTIQLASGSPAGAGFSVSSDLTSIGNNQYTTTITLTTSNVAGYVTPTAVDGYNTSITVSGQTITITYEEIGPNMTISRNVTIPIDSEYSGTTFTLSSSELSSIASFLGISATNFKSTSIWNGEEWSEELSSGKVQLYAVSPNDGTTLVQAGYTATPFPGHWFTSGCERVVYGEGDEALFSTYDIASATFSIGQFPSALAQGNTYTIRQAAVYNKNGTNYTVYFVINVTMAASGTTPSTSYSYTLNVVNNPGTGGITAKSGLTYNSTFDTYECSTQLTSSNVSTYASAVAVSGYSAELTVVGSVITVTYTQIATTTYTVAYSGLTTSQGAGFSVVSGSGATKNSNTQVTLPTEVTSNTVGSYITPTAVDNYQTTMTVSGTTITITYTRFYTYTIQLASGSPTGAGFTLSGDLVSQGSSQYTSTDEITSANVTNYVTPTPVSGYSVSVSISGTTITVTYTAKQGVTIHKILKFAIDGEDYTGTTVTLSSSDLQSIATLFGVETTFLTTTGNWNDEEWSSSPGNGVIQLYAVDPSDGATLVQAGYTATPFPGHWFNSGSQRVTYGEGNETFFSTYDIATSTFTVGQFPGMLEVGNGQSFTQAIVYTNNGQQYVAYIEFTISMLEEGSTPVTENVYTIQLADGSPSGAGFTSTMTSLGDNQYSTSVEITDANVATYVTPTVVNGYDASLSVSGYTITVTYTKDNNGTEAETAVTTFTPNTANTVTYTLSLDPEEPTEAAKSQAIDTSTLTTYFNNQALSTSNFKGYSTTLSTGAYYVYYYGANSATVDGMKAQAPTTSGSTYTYYYNKYGHLLTSAEGAAFSIQLNTSDWTYTVTATDNKATPGDYTLYTAMRCYYKRRSTSSTVYNYMVYFQFNVNIPDLMPGDLNQSGHISISDVSALVEYLKGNTENYHRRAANADENDVINIQDIETQLDTILQR